jgi:putative membrane protein
MKLSSKSTLAALAAVAVFAVAGLPSQAAELDASDARFLQAASGAGMFEVQAAELAGKRAKDAQVRAFAAKMLEQHTAVNKELKALAASKNVSLPGQPAEPERATLLELRDRTGAAFDQLYIQKVALDAHVTANRLFETAAKESQDAQVRDFAVRTLPMLSDHYLMSRALQRDPAANGDKIHPAPKGEAPPVSPASRAAPASVVPEK